MKVSQPINIFAFILLITLAFLASAEQNHVPQFRDYPARSTYKGKPAKPILLSAEEKLFRTRLREASQQSVNFAGEYVLSTWGCGAACIYGAVVSLRTGRVTFLPGSICCWEGGGKQLEFRANSRLIVAAGVINEQGEYGAHFYEFEKEGFKHLKTIPLSK